MNKTAAAFVMTVIVAVLAGCTSKEKANPPVVSVESDDKEMNTAIQKAQGSLNDFITKLQNPGWNDKWFLVKGKFSKEDNVEHIGIADVKYDCKVFSGVLADEPKLPGLRFKQPVSVPLKEITDWMYVSQGRLIGGFTTRVLYSRLSPEKRREDDASRPFRID